jgi:20S proteasome alpha/beta subunit
VALLVGGYNGKPELYATEVTGNYLKYKATAIGENDEAIRVLLREKYNPDLTCNEGVKIALQIFKEIQGDNFNKERFDVGIIGTDKKIEKKRGRDF